MLSEEHDVDSTSYLVSLLLGFGIHTSDICQSVPRNVEANARFVVDAHKLRKSEDVKCNDCGSWINNGVRKLYLSVKNQNNPDLLDVIVIKRGGKPPSEIHWCLTRTYFVHKGSRDFRKIIVSLQGI